MIDLSRYLLEALRTDEEFILYRGLRTTEEVTGPPSFLALSPRMEHPAPSTIKKIEHEFSLRDELDPAWAIRPIAITEQQGRTMLLLEDPNGAPLDQLLEGPMELKQFLHYGIALAAALGKVHGRGLVHKDIKPANIFANDAIDRVWLTGFGIASRSPRERQSGEPAEFILGTLAYMAPEQTGRMNRSIDSRSDLYALGVTFYELATGSLPFSASDPMEWVHCHIARQPLPPAERLRGIPHITSAIIMKLLAKTPEERYRTAEGVESDLRRCLEKWELERDIHGVALGENDRPDRLLIPEKLYGRGREIHTLLTSFERVVNGGAPELVLVSGYSGIGKSSVVNELHRVLVPPRGLFASGKFDQYKRDIPYSTLGQAFRSLTRRLLTKSEAELAPWRDAMRAALGPNGRLIIDLVPELKAIIGEQPPVPELPPQDAQRRFQLVTRRFIGVFARREHPLALFLDDLQWLDSATLEVLEDLLTQADVQHLLIIGAYRDNEVNSVHPLARKLAGIRKAGASITEIKLGPLSQEDVARLITDTLQGEVGAVVPLAQAIYKKTAGNPFFTIQFLSALEQERLLAFDYAHGCWRWDLGRIHAKQYTDNVVDLMVGKLTRLPTETQKALQQLACLGNTASVTTLSVVYGVEEPQVHSDLFEAVRAEMVERQEGSYRFIHDRVQEAAYSLIPEAQRADAHLRIGRLLATHTPSEKRDEAIFEIVNQLNRGAKLVTSQDEKEQLAEFNLIAGKRAKASTAYVSALSYLVAGGVLTSNDGWERRPELMFALELHRAECEFLTGELAAAEERLTMLSLRAINSVDRALVTCLRIDLYTVLNRSDYAIEVCLTHLRHLGIEWSLHPTEDEARREYERTWSLLGGREIEELIDLPLMSKPESLATLEVLTHATSAALFTDGNLYSLILWRMVNLSLEQGNTDASCIAYVHLGADAGPRFGNYQAGFRFGRLGYDLVQQRGLTRFRARTYLGFAVLIMSWTKHWRRARALIRDAFEAANIVGDLTWAAYSLHNLIGNLLAAGDPLVDVQREAELGLEFAEKARFGLVIDNHTTQLALTRTLRGLTPSFGSFNDTQFDELEFERHLSSDPRLAFAACWYWTRKLQARFFAGDYAAAVDASLKAQRLLWTSPSFLESAEASFYAALSRAASCNAASPHEYQQHVQRLAAHHKQLLQWAENCPENYRNRAALVGAEIARIEGRELDAERLYEEAIQSAHQNEFVHNEGIANELAGRFYAGRGFETISRAYLRNARYCYLRWGADGKVRQLDELYPYLKAEEAAPSSNRTIGTFIEQLDVATVIRVSQAVSGEMVLEKLLDTVMRTAIEHAGAERALLTLSIETEQRIVVEAATSTEGVIVQLLDEPVTASMLPETVVRYVLHTLENVILDDAAILNPFSRDPYFGQRHARSVLCLPLTNQAKLIGVLYLENNLAPRVFAPARTAVLKLLASQAAISLENARLYAAGKTREAKIRRLVDANIIGIFIVELGGQIIEANDAFLRMLGYEREDLVSGAMRWPDLTPPEWRAADAERLERIRKVGSLQPFEKEYFRKDGTRVPVLVGVARFEETRNQAVVFALDMSEQKRAENALRRSEADLHEAQRLTHTGSWKLDVASGRVTVSPEIFRIFDARPGEDVSSPEFWFDRIHPEDRARVREYFGRCVAEKLHYEADYRIVLPDGTIRYQHSIGRPILGVAGTLVEFLGTAMDVTEQVRASLKLESAFEEIKQLKDRLQDENVVLREQIDQAFMFEEIVGASPALKTVLSRVSKVAATDSTVLLTGETGTGKELIARAIHKRSQRSSRAFISVNCAAIPASLIASELFGHEKGAFTGAVARRLGRFELAEEGTIFLDEVGELPAETQIALLRVLQEREFERVGGNRTLQANVRVIAATNRDLRAAIAAGTFRSDLFYRLNVFPIEVPPLRERKEDIPLLVEYFISRFVRKAGKNIHGINKKSLDRILSYSWPGNIRELQNVIERSVIVCETESLSVDNSWLPQIADVARPQNSLQLSQLVVQEKELIEAALRKSGGRVFGPSGAASKLGIPGTTLESKIRSLKINKNRFKPAVPG